MAILVTDCPRCGAQKSTFDNSEIIHVGTGSSVGIEYEAFAVCRLCHSSTIFILHLLPQLLSIRDRVRERGPGTLFPSLNDGFEVVSFVSLANMVNRESPGDLPTNIGSVFKEATVCMSVNCYNAAGTMFRLCLDLATKPLVAELLEKKPNAKIGRTLGSRLPILFTNNMLPKDLEDLSHCIKDDGNDGAHDGTLSSNDAEDLYDFTFEALETLYTKPAKLARAKERRNKRRNQDNTG